MRRDLPGGQSLGGQRQHDLIDAGQPTLTLLHDHRIKVTVGVSRYLDLDRPDLGKHRLRSAAVAGIAAAAPGRVMLVIAQVLGHLGIQRGLQHVLGQLIEQAVWAHQLHTLFFCLGEQLLGKLLVIHIDRHRFECFGHHQSFPPSSRPACQTKTRSTVIQTVPGGQRKSVR